MSEPVVMPFGKHKGRVLSRVPHGYLKRVLGSLDVREPLRGQLRAVLDGKPIRPAPPDEEELIAELFARGKGDGGR